MERYDHREAVAGLSALAVVFSVLGMMLYYELQACGNDSGWLAADIWWRSALVAAFSGGGAGRVPGRCSSVVYILGGVTTTHRCWRWER
jgi:hypothetical protein